MGSTRLRKYIISMMAVLAFVLATAQVISAQANDEADGSGKQVYVIPIEKEVEMGLKAFLQRTTSEAEEKGADHILFEIDTPGGAVAAAEQLVNCCRD